MSRIASGVLIAVAALILIALFPQDSFATEPGARPGQRIEVRDAAQVSEGSRIMALLLALEALRERSASAQPR